MAYRPKRRWAASQVLFLKENYDKLKDEEIADILKKTPKAVTRKRTRMQLEKASGRGVCKAKKD